MAAPPAHCPEFDVFLSFRGFDTRNNFVSHLQASLRRKGIDSFVDHRLRRGDAFGQNRALQDLHHRLLQELCQLRMVSPGARADPPVPVENQSAGDTHLLHGFSPSDVRNQTGSFAVLFERPEETFPGMVHLVPGWKAALSEASKIAGHVLTGDGSEADVVEEIAQETFKMLHDLTPCDNEDLVGVEPRLETLEKLLSCNESDTVRVIGITGMGGLGSCFLANIRENSRRSGLGPLLRELLSRLLNEENLEIGAPDTALEAFKDRLRNKRLLVVLDDVNNEKQIRCLMGQRKWFQEGSRIIITTRDRKLINMAVDVIFPVPKLNHREALQLFSLNAFNNNLCLKKEFMSLSNMFLDYAKGHPFALKVLGSHLCERDKLFWENKLEELKVRSDGEIQEVLEISYEELSIEQKNIFLDIACFFRSENLGYVTSLLNCRGVDASSVIRDLVDKCLITVSDNLIEMHDLLQTMGKEVSSKACTKETGHSSRLWEGEDICHLLMNKKGATEIRGIFLDTLRVGEMRLSSKAFKGMCNLRYLKIYNSHCSRGCEADCRVQFPKELTFLPEGLTYLQWQGCPLQNLPPDFNPKNLVDLKLQFSHIKQFWDDDKDTGKLKWVDLSHSLKLRKICGLSKAQNLERLNLEGCASLKSFRRQ